MYTEFLIILLKKYSLSRQNESRWTDPSSEKEYSVFYELRYSESTVDYNFDLYRPWKIL
jgi:hypothetical protein